MPQMSPMWWSTLMMMFVLIYITTMMVMYFFNIYGMKNIEKMKTSKKLINWKW